MIIKEIRIPHSNLIAIEHHTENEYINGYYWQEYLLSEDLNILYGNLLNNSNKLSEIKFSLIKQIRAMLRYNTTNSILNEN
jgi:hypothetical protein